MSYEIKVPIPSRVYNAATGGHVAGAEDIDFGQKVVHLVKYDHSGNEVSFASQLTAQNTIYVIHDDFTLTADVTIPSGCTLKFEGGSISGAYTITGQNTGIEAGLLKIFNTNVTLAGSWNVAEAYPEWFGAKGDGVTDDTASIQQALFLANVSSIRRCKLCNKQYNITTIHVGMSVELCGGFGRNRLTLNSGTVLRLYGNNDHHIYTDISSYIHDISIIQPEILDKPLNDGEWAQNQISESFSKACIYANGDAATYVRIENITFILAAIGIQFDGNHENLFLNNILGACLIYGIKLSTSSDVDKILNCHFNGNYIGNGAIVDSSIKTAVYKYIYKYGAALSFTRLDGCVIDDFFAYGYHYGIVNINELHTTGMETIVNSGFDGCWMGMLLYNPDLRIENCWFTSFDPWNTGIQGECCLYNLTDKGSSTIISNCWFYAYQGTAIQGYCLKIQGCKFDASIRKNRQVIDVVLLSKTSYMNNCLFNLTNQYDVTRAIHVTEGGHLILNNTIFKGHPNPILGLIALDAIGSGGIGVVNGSNNVAIDDNNEIQVDAQSMLLETTLNKGTTAQRDGTYELIYFDTTLNKPVFYTGSAWVDSTGTPV